MTETLEAASLLQVDLQCAVEDADAEEPPSIESLTTWAQRAYGNLSDQVWHNYFPAEVTIRLVESAEMQELNRQYRNKDQVTNVLSFPVVMEEDILKEMAVNLLGDVIICHPVILREAQQQGKSIADHYAHMVTHGILHLCGYDHQHKQAAEHMEALETKILAQSDIANPYI